MENNAFEYTYSAQRQQEVEEIRKVYLPKEEDKLAQLRKLHAVPTQKAQAAALAIGLIGVLILGTGMSLCMTELGSAFGSLSMIFGIIVGLIGLAMVAAAHPIFNWVLKMEREKIASEILKLTDELL